MTSTLVVRAALPDIDGLAADDVVNSFAFNAATSPAAVVADVHDFYNGANTHAPLASYIASSRHRAASMVVKVYDIGGHLDGKHLESPVLIDTSTALNAPGNPNQLPDQVAAILGYHGVLSALPEHGPAVERPTGDEAQDQGAPAIHSANSRPRASLRGRLFLGPLNLLTIGSDGGLDANFSDDLVVAAKRLAAKPDGWSVWSRTYQTMVDVVGGWIESELATQRRRRDKTVLRTTYTAP